MLSEDKEKKLLELFIALDEFCLALYEWQNKQTAKPRAATNKPTMSDSELLTILVFYHFSGTSALNTTTRSWCNKPYRVTSPSR